MTLTSNATFDEKLIFYFKNDKNLVNLDQSIRNCQDIHFDCSFCAKYITFDLKKYRVILHDTEEW